MNDRVYMKVPGNWGELTDDAKRVWSEGALDALLPSDRKDAEEAPTQEAPRS